VWASSPESDRILFDGDVEPSAAVAFFVYDRRADQVTRLTTDLPCTPDSGFPTVVAPSQPVWLNEQEALVHAVRAGESGYYRFNVDSARLSLEHATGTVSVGFSVDARHRYIAQSHSSLDSTGEVAVFDRQSG